MLRPARMIVLTLLLFLSQGHAYALTISNSILPDATQYQPYSASVLTVSQGTPPYTWSVTSAYSSLPEGMHLNAATGVISASSVGGQGAYLFQVRVSDSLGATATATAIINVAADNTLGGCDIFPADSIFRQRVDFLPLDTSPAAQIYSDYQSSHIRVFFGSEVSLEYPDPNGIPLFRVPYNQPLVKMTFTLYGDESDAPYGWIGANMTTYPFPANAPVEGSAYSGGDMHVLILQTAGGGQSCKLWEVWQGIYNGDSTWSSSNGTYWNLGSNNLRTNGYTSGDAAGLPIMPYTVNFDEVASGTVNHAIRFTVNHMLNGYVWPARHAAGYGQCNDVSGPIPAGSELSQSAPPLSCTRTGPSGQIYRLTSAAYATASAACPGNTHPQANVIIKAMRQYGIILADNGQAGGLIGTPDSRWDTNDLSCLTNIALSQFEPVNVSSLRISADSGATKSIRLVHDGSQVNVYATFHNAYTAASDGDTIQAKAFDISETLMLTGNIDISLKGGYDSAFETNSLMTTIHGSLTITGGAATIDKIAIQ